MDDIRYHLCKTRHSCCVCRNESPDAVDINIKKICRIVYINPLSLSKNKQYQAELMIEHCVNMMLLYIELKFRLLKDKELFALAPAEMSLPAV